VKKIEFNRHPGNERTFKRKSSAIGSAEGDGVCKDKKGTMLIEAMSGLSPVSSYPGDGKTGEQDIVGPRSGFKGCFLGLWRILSSTVRKRGESGEKKGINDVTGGGGGGVV